MGNKSMNSTTKVWAVGGQHKEIAGHLGKGMPLEVVTLLGVFARIEARRQARLREEERKLV